jgi:hypothetical protein
MSFDIKENCVEQRGVVSRLDWMIKKSYFRERVLIKRQIFIAPPETFISPCYAIIDDSHRYIKEIEEAIFCAV